MSFPGWSFGGEPRLEQAVLGALEGLGPERREAARNALGHLGPLVQQRERDAWARRTWPAGPADRQAAALWDAWFDGRPWQGRDAWETAYLPAAIRAFAGVLAAAHVPLAARERAHADLVDAFFFVLLGGDPPGYATLAAHVAETMPPERGAGPIDALAPGLGPGSREATARCLLTRGAWPATVGAVWPELRDPLSRTAAIREWIARPRALERLVDAHVALRLADRWRSAPPGDPSADWRVVTQNRGRARGRLRALLATNEHAWLREALRRGPALHARTSAAVARFAWSWAWRQLSVDFAFDDDRGASPRCPVPGPPADRLGDEDRARLRTWILLVVLRGRLTHLRRWVREGTTGDRDTTWGRLLADDLPDSLRDPQGGRYLRLRTWLGDHLAEEMEALDPTLRAVAALEPDRRLADRLRALLAPGWAAAVPFPRGGFPKMVSRARELLLRAGSSEPEATSAGAAARAWPGPRT